MKGEGFSYLINCTQCRFIDSDSDLYRPTLSERRYAKFSSDKISLNCQSKLYNLKSTNSFSIFLIAKKVHTLFLMPSIGLTVVWYGSLYAKEL